MKKKLSHGFSEWTLMVFKIGDHELERNGKKMRSDRASLLQSWSPIMESQYLTISRKKENKERAVFNVASQKPFLKDIVGKCWEWKEEQWFKKVIHCVRLLRWVNKIFRWIYLKDRIKVFGANASNSLRKEAFIFLNTLSFKENATENRLC